VRRRIGRHLTRAMCVIEATADQRGSGQSCLVQTGSSWFDAVESKPGREGGFFAQA
jgi:hypothetical protein